jgi:diguanylate cyclase (GGDEF)-like protein
MSTAGPAEQVERHKGLRYFLIGVRIVGVIAALVVTRAHADPLVMYNELTGMSALVTGGVVFYHVVAGFLTGMTNNKAVATVLSFTDLASGLSLTYFYGEGYFLLAFALPVLSLCGAYGLTAALAMGVFGLIFYGLVYALPLMEKGDEIGTLTLRLSLSGVQVAVSLLMAWLYSIAVTEGNKTQAVREEAQQTTELLYRELSERTENVELVYAEMTDQESKVKTLSKQIAHLEHELQEAYKDVAKARMAVTSKEDLAEEKVSKISGEMERERQALERERQMVESQAERLEYELSHRQKTLDGFRQLLVSLSLEETLLSLVYYLQARIPSAVCVVFMKEDVQGTSYLYPEVADAEDTDFFRELAIPVGELAVGHVAVSGDSLLIPAGHVELNGKVLATLEGQGESALIAPLRNPSDGKVLGVIYLGRMAAAAFKPTDMTMVEEFLELAGIAVARCMEFRTRVGGGLHDLVTGLHNGLYLAERMEEEVRRGRRYTYPVSLLLVDIDNFTPMAERLDTEVIDNVLRQVAGLILEAIRDTDVASRIEADDFGVLLVHSDRDSAVPIGERIRQEVSEATFGTPGQPLRLTVSVGVAGVPHDASDAQRLKEAAFGAIADARAKGGNRVSIYPR